MPTRFFPLIAAIVIVVFAAGPTPAQRKDEYQALQGDILTLQGFIKDLQTSVKDLQRNTDNKTQNLQTLLERVVDRVNLMGGEIQTGVQGTVQTGIQSIAQSNQANTDKIARMLDDLKAQDDKHNRDLAMSLQAMNADVAKLNNGLADKIVAAMNEKIIERTDKLGEKLSRDMTGMQLQTDAMGVKIEKLAESLKQEVLPSPQQMLREATVDYIAGLYDFALEGFDKVLSNYPNQPVAVKAQLFKGETYYAQSKWNEAIDAYNSLLKKEVDRDTKRTALYKKALSLAYLKKEDEAKDEFQKVVEEFPDTSEAVNAKAKIIELTPPPPVPAGRGATAAPRGGATPPAGRGGTPRGGN